MRISLTLNSLTLYAQAAVWAVYLNYKDAKTPAKPSHRTTKPSPVPNSSNPAPKSTSTSNNATSPATPAEPNTPIILTPEGSITEPEQGHVDRRRASQDEGADLGIQRRREQRQADDEYEVHQNPFVDPMPKAAQAATRDV